MIEYKKYKKVKKKQDIKTNLKILTKYAVKLHIMLNF